MHVAPSAVAVRAVNGPGLMRGDGVGGEGRPVSLLEEGTFISVPPEAEWGLGG